MDDLIYILLGIAWIAIAFYRQSQKKKAQAKPKPVYHHEDEQTETRNAGSILEDILLGKNPDTIFKTAEYQEENNEIVYEAVQTTDSFEEEYDRLGYESIEEKIQEPVQDIEDKDLDSPIYKGDLTDDDKLREEAFQIDLRKAVIYSEILNRPQF